MEFPENIWTAFAAIDPTWLTFALAFILLDIITGICKGAATHTLSSQIMREGFWHKLAVIFALCIAACIDAAAGAGLDLGFEVPVFEAVCGYVVIMELLSILENISVINPELAGSAIFKLLTPPKESEE